MATVHQPTEKHVALGATLSESAETSSGTAGSRVAPFDENSPHLALIVGGARSGTTLLRFLLDAHPDIGCPPEAGIPGLVAHMAHVWQGVNSAERSRGRTHGDTVARGWATPTDDADATSSWSPAGLGGARGRPGERMLPLACRQWIRGAVGPLMRGYCEQHGKRVYVDKSLDSAFALAPTFEVFPELRLVLVFRHVMDTIVSGMDASPWGFTHYGYNRYVRDSPENIVAALGRYWLDHVSAALDWEDRQPETCLRVRYEDLVAAPELTVRGVQSFLRVPEDLTVLDDAFTRPVAHGPGDHKVWYTTAIERSSAGRGKRIPVTLLPRALLDAINEKLAILGYPHLDDSWNATGRPIDAGRETIWTRLLKELMERAAVSASCPHHVAFVLAAEDDGSLRWTIDTTARTVESGANDADSVLIGTTQDLVLLVMEQANPAELLRCGRVRHLRANREGSPSPDVPSLDTILSVLRDGLVDMSGGDA